MLDFSLGLNREQCDKTDREQADVYAAAPMHQVSIPSTRAYTLERAANVKELSDVRSPSLFLLKKAWNSVIVLGRLMSKER